MTSFQKNFGIGDGMEEVVEFGGVSIRLDIVGSSHIFDDDYEYVEYYDYIDYLYLWGYIEGMDRLSWIIGSLLFYNGFSTEV